MLIAASEKIYFCHVWRIVPAAYLNDIKKKLDYTDYGGAPC
jgi:hypothetical protein